MAEATTRLLAVIPARGGSKRLPRKNVRPLAGRPLIAWSIAAALDSGACEAVLVSTDDEEIAATAREAGASVPWLRPAALATDTAPTQDVLCHALDWYEAAYGRVEAVVLLQPTSPLRRPGAVREAAALYLAQPAGGRCAVVSVSPAATHPAWTFRLAEDGTMQPFLGWDPLRSRSQDLPAAYALNGSIYIIPAASVREGLPPLAPGVLPFVMEEAHDSVDIDTEADWMQAQALAEDFLRRHA